MIEVGSAFVATSEPRDYDEALQSEDKINWKTAMMDQEFDSLQRNRTWKHVKLPEGRKLIDNRWVFKVKEKPNGEVERFKARLVIRGFTQEYGIDYGETFSPVAKFTSIVRLLLWQQQKDSKRNNLTSLQHSCMGICQKKFL